jgi:hypothetical protein
VGRTPDLLYWGIIAIVLVLCVALIVGGIGMFLHFNRRSDEEIGTAFQDRNADMRQHDRTVQALTPEAFEQHKRTCPRCRGEVLGRYSVGTDALTEFRS